MAGEVGELQTASALSQDAELIPELLEMLDERFSFNPAYEAAFSRTSKVTRQKSISPSHPLLSQAQGMKISQERPNSGRDQASHEVKGRHHTRHLQNGGCAAISQKLYQRPDQAGDPDLCRTGQTTPSPLSPEIFKSKTTGGQKWYCCLVVN